MHKLETWKCPLFHSCLYFKKAPSPWNFHGEGHLSAPDLGLASSNLPCDLRIPARTFTEISVLGWLAPSCASRLASALRCSSSAWRLEVAPLRHYKLATKVSGNLCSHCGMQTTIYSVYIYMWLYLYVSIYQYQSHSFRGLPAATRKRVGTVWGSCRCQSACAYIDISYYSHL